MKSEMKGSEKEYASVLRIIVQRRAKALSNVNAQNLLTNWEIGAFISRRLANSAWGSAAVDGLVDYIHSHDPTAKGYGRSNLYSMVAVYEAFSSADFLTLLARQASFVQPTAAQIELSGFVQPAAGQMSNAKEVVQPVAGQSIPPVLFLTTFTNLVEIINRVRTAQERLFYIVYAHRENLRKLELRRCLVNDTYSTLLGGDKKNLSAALKRLYPASPVMFKDTALVDFLNIPERHREKRLRRGIVDHIKQFILELGKDFLFVDEEYTLQVGGKDFHSDLLFYHRGLQCLVAFELKARDFKPSDMGQLEFYLEALDRNVKKANENPSIGVLLCKNADRSVVEYALSRTMSPAMVAEYKRMLIPKEVLQRTFDEYLALPGAVAREKADSKSAAVKARTDENGAGNGN